VEGALQSHRLGGNEAQENAAVKAIKAEAPAGSGGGSKKLAMVWNFSGGSKSSSSTWAEREALAKAAIEKGGKIFAAAKRIEALALPIATHSHECMEPQCRRPVKLVTDYSGGRMYTNFTHKCMAKKSRQVTGLGKHLCSSCHQTARTCKDAICRYPVRSAPQVNRDAHIYTMGLAYLGNRDRTHTLS